MRGWLRGAACRRCGHVFSSRMHVEDLIEVQRRLGFRYEVPDSPVEHYQWICPRCRRAAFAMAQSLLWKGQRGGGDVLPDALPLRPMPVYANPEQGPLGEEDSTNFHP